MEKLAINGGKPTIEGDKGRFIWPKFDSCDEQDLIKQLHTSVSIYDKSGVFKEFEDEFSNFHNVAHSILFNSGTSALSTLFKSLDLKHGDEVLCPVYTFHATVSPLIEIGVIPRFCDSDYHGNICFKEITSKYSEKTKAVIVTHMWGMPVKDIRKIADFCDKKNIPLIEDCSHAHGATLDNKIVGSFGTCAAWSLQGNKTITGGEGGIITTNSKNIFYKALLNGHYNKRPKQEIERDNEWYEYYLTGFGQKLRAHPLAIRLALNQFRKLPSVISQRFIFAQQVYDSLRDIPFLSILTPPENTVPSNYALVFQYNKEKAYGVDKEKFVEALHSEGLCEIDIPSSTGLLNTLPLFLKPDKVFPLLYSKPFVQQEGFYQAELFHQQIIKMPVWSDVDDVFIVQKYIEGIKKVSNYILNNKNI